MLCAAALWTAVPGAADAAPAKTARARAQTAKAALDTRGALQVLRVIVASWDTSKGRAQRFERAALGQPFLPVGEPLPVQIGRSGLAWRSDADAPPPPGPGPRKREGDGRAPAGVLALGEMWGYGEAAPSGVRLRYHQADAHDRCVDDAQSRDYAQLRRAPASGEAPWRSAELLRMSSDHYKYLVIVDYNMRASIPGAGSCIFLHVAPPPGGPTAGCTALAEEELLQVLRWLDPRKHPVLLQLPAPALAAAAAAWRLPTELSGER